jgi:type I restriction enzyme S subunit
MISEIGKHLNILSGFPFNSDLFNIENNGMPLIRIRNLVQSYSETYFSGEYNENYIISKGDILVGMDGDFNAVKWNGINSLLNQRICKIEINESLLNKEFMFQNLQSELNKIHSKTAATTVKHLSIKDIKKIKIFFPPLEEQKKIADILSTVDKKIAFVEENITTTQELKKGLMQKLLTQGLGHTEFKDSELGMIPESWEVKSIEEIAEVKGGKRLPKGSLLSEEKTFYPYIRVTNMFMGGIDLSEIQYVPEDIQPKIKNYTISKNDLFISVAGTLGIVGEVPEKLDNANLTENADKITNIKINKKYLLYVLMSNLIQNEISKQTTSNAQPKLALTRIKTFKIPIPPLEEQKQIAEILSTVDKKLEILKEKKETFTELKKGLMQKLLTGEVRV